MCRDKSREISRAKNGDLRVERDAESRIPTKIIRPSVSAERASKSHSAACSRRSVRIKQGLVMVVSLSNFDMRYILTQDIKH